MAESMATVSQIATGFGIPTIVGEEGMVLNGGLATYGIDYYKLGQLAGAQAVSILKGESKPEDMAIECGYGRLHAFLQLQDSRKTRPHAAAVRC